MHSDFYTIFWKSCGLFFFLPYYTIYRTVAIFKNCGCKIIINESVRNIGII